MSNELKAFLVDENGATAIDRFFDFGGCHRDVQQDGLPIEIHLQRHRQ
jgi:hypothetical protein